MRSARRISLAINSQKTNKTMMSNLKFNEELRRLEPLEHLRIVLRGAGQVMFQPSAWSGLFFMAGIFWGAYSSHTPEVAWGAVLGLLVSTLTGYWIDMPSEDGRQGLWGFNGVLVGCAFPTFLGNTVWAPAYSASTQPLPSAGITCPF